MRPLSKSYMRSILKGETILVHLSSVADIEVLKSKVPETAVFEDKRVSRVCFSDSIDKALSALQGDIGTYYVYSPKLEDTSKFYKPSRSEVFDVDFTSEVWSLVDVPVRCIAKIEVSKIIKIIEYNIPRKPWITCLRLCDWRFIEN